MVAVTVGLDRITSKYIYLNVG